MEQSVTSIVDAVRASGRLPSVTAVCRVLVLELGLRNSPDTRTLALAAVEALGLLAPTEKTLEHQLKPSVHTDVRIEANRTASRASMVKARSTTEGLERLNAKSRKASRNNPLSKMIGNCRKRTEWRGHDPVDEVHLVDLWERGRAGESPWHGLLDFSAYGVAEETGKAGSPWAPSFDRLDNDLGYVVGNVQLVPNIWNKSCNRYDRRLVLDLVARAARLRAEGRKELNDVRTLRQARPLRYRLETYLSYSGASVFRHHPALVSHGAEMMDRTLEALYGAGGGVCSVTGLSFSAEPGHPCRPSWDLLDHRLCATRQYTGAGKMRRVVLTEGGRETPADMRLVCAFFNVGRCTFDDGDWWRMADRVRELVEAGVPT